MYMMLTLIIYCVNLTNQIVKLVFLYILDSFIYQCN